MAVADDVRGDGVEQAVIERLEVGVGDFRRAPAQMDRQPLFPALELPVMEEPQTGCEKSDDRRSLMHPGRENGGGPRFVVVFEEPRQPPLIIEIGDQMIADRAGVLLAQPVVEPLVVGVVEALLHECPFEIPVDLGHERELRRRPPRPGDGVGPEVVDGDAPGALEHFGKDQHRHVAADAVAEIGDRQDFPPHRLLQLRVSVVELQRVGPAGEIGIAAVGEDDRSPRRFDPAVVLRGAGEI